jgi:hypothetical protein
MFSQKAQIRMYVDSLSLNVLSEQDSFQLREIVDNLLYQIERKEELYQSAMAIVRRLQSERDEKI